VVKQPVPRMKRLALWKATLSGRRWLLDKTVLAELDY